MKKKIVVKELSMGKTITMFLFFFACVTITSMIFGMIIGFLPKELLIKTENGIQVQTLGWRIFNLLFEIIIMFVFYILSLKLSYMDFKELFKNKSK